MSKLKKDFITIGEDRVTLYELSALNRIEYLEYVFSAKKSIPEDEDQTDDKIKAASILTIKDFAMLVALSLSQAPSESREASELLNEVISDFGVDGLTRAAQMVRELSGMLTRGDNTSEEDAEPVSLEKS